MSCDKELCDRDLSILELLFDKSEKFEDVKLEDYNKPIRDEIDVADDDEGNSEEILKSKDYEMKGVKLTEVGKFEQALVKFNEAICCAPKRPSPYNNRAQLYRFLKEDQCKFI